MYMSCVIVLLGCVAPLVGILMAMNGLAIQHDANHGAFSSQCVSFLLCFLSVLRIELFTSSSLYVVSFQALAEPASGVPRRLDWRICPDVVRCVLLLPTHRAHSHTRTLTRSLRRHQHVIAHHAHPNDSQLDADTFNNFPLMKTNPSLPHRWYLSFQVCASVSF